MPSQRHQRHQRQPNAKPHRRLVVLVRHGQYDTTDTTNGRLTRVGREQASRTGQFLARASFDGMFTSNLPRALETAALVGAGVRMEGRASPLLREGFPTKLKGYAATAASIAEDRARFEAAFERFFKKPVRRSTELVVCHGNIIRYFVCRALGIAVRRWIQLGTNHTGITRIVVKDNGDMGVASYNETSHLPRKLVT